MSMKRLVCALLYALAVAAPASVAAQDQSHWGVAGTFIPRWEFLNFLEDAMERNIEMIGDDVRVGIIRGRQLGGEWGAMYVRRRIEDDSIVMQQETLKCVSRPGQSDVCARGTFHRPRAATLTGVQFHRFFPVATIARRLQIGAVVSGGVARLEGTAEEVQEHLQISVNAQTGATSLTIGSDSSIVEARQMFDDTPVSEYVPIGGIEGAVAVMVAPGVKLRVSGGVSFPGAHKVAVTAQYLFGSR